MWNCLLRTNLDHFFHMDKWVNPSSAGLVHVRGTELVIAVPADAITPHGARPSAGTALTESLDKYIYCYPWLYVTFMQLMTSFIMADEM